MNEEHAETSPQVALARTTDPGLVAARHRARPREGWRAPPPPPASPAGIARTVLSILAMPWGVLVELGVEAARTVGAVFSSRSDR